MQIKNLRAGLSLVEVMVATTVMAVVVGISMSLLTTSQSAVVSGTIAGDLEGKALAMMEKMAVDMRFAVKDSIAIQDSYPHLQFRKVTSYLQTVEGTIEPQSTGLINLGLEDGETNVIDGIDNNNNGLVDEKTLVREEGGRKIVLARNVKELTFEWRSVGSNGQDLSMMITMIAVDPKKSSQSQTIEVSHQTNVFVRE